MEKRFCIHCQRNEDEVTLKKCPMCFRRICFSCAYAAMGRYFCSRSCADMFFWGEE